MSKPTDSTFEQARAYKAVVEKLWAQPVFEASRALVPCEEAATVLVAEARCGFVPLELLSVLKEGTRIIALDGHDAMLDVARKRAESVDTQKRIFFVDQRVGKISYADGVFRAGICFDGLLTLRQTEQAMGELARVSADGATVLIAAPLAESFPEFYDILDEALRAHDLLELVAPRIAKLKRTLLTPSRLAALARAAGLTQIAVEKLSWELAFAGGHEFLQSPLIRETFFPHWLGLIPSSDREPVLRYVGDAIDTYWHGRIFRTQISAALLSAKASDGDA
ncbi:class I SAM-dependent methyltransferase [Bradymonas sediminis]|uniref:class I SAM-dependent methyltransferase n=1 Tax=Bradymonas sediminis TaxID=1548548 RepID=UPI0010EA6AD6|nr:class I SAM-dependent methyltransferase [Bradymonas sediminis]TDP75915.1 methyltransferase family protein [Bradymonas sediminis]